LLAAAAVNMLLLLVKHGAWTPVSKYRCRRAETVDNYSRLMHAALTAAGPVWAGIEACPHVQDGADSWLLLLASIGGCCCAAIKALTNNPFIAATSVMSGCCRAITCTGSEQPNMGSFHMVQYLLSK
jgi:hypothetical protein